MKKGIKNKALVLWVRWQAGGKGVGFGFVCLER